MAHRDLRHEPTWFRALVYTLAGAFILVTVLAGAGDLFYGTVGR